MGVAFLPLARTPPDATAAVLASLGLGITLGNLATGAPWDFAARHDARWLTWYALTAAGLICAASVARLARRGHLAVRERPQLAAP